MELETCGNCGRTIGKLETSHVFDDKVVCGECLALLNRPASYASPEARSAAATRHRIVVVALLVTIAAILAVGVGAWGWKTYREYGADVEKQKLNVFLDDRKAQGGVITSYFESSVASFNFAARALGMPGGGSRAEINLNTFIGYQNADDDEITSMLHRGVLVDNIIKSKRDCSVKNAARVLSETLDPSPQQVESARRTVGLAPRGR